MAPFVSECEQTSFPFLPQPPTHSPAIQPTPPTLAIHLDGLRSMLSTASGLYLWLPCNQKVGFSDDPGAGLP